MKYLALLSIFLALPVYGQSLPFCSHGNLVNKSLTSDVTDTSVTTIIASPGASQRLYIGALCVTNNDATVGTVVKVTCSATAANAVRLNAGAVNGGFCQPLPFEIKCDQNTALTIQAETTSAQLQAAAWACRAFD